MISKISENYDKICKLFEDLKENHEKNIHKGNRSSGSRARKILGELKKEITPYRKYSVEFNKKEK